MAKAKATTSVTPISLLGELLVSSPVDSLAEMVSARTPTTSDSTSAVTPRRIGSLRTG